MNLVQLFKKKSKITIENSTLITCQSNSSVHHLKYPFQSSSPKAQTHTHTLFPLKVAHGDQWRWIFSLNNHKPTCQSPSTTWFTSYIIIYYWLAPTLYSTWQRFHRFLLFIHSQKKWGSFFHIFWFPELGGGDNSEVDSLIFYVMRF